MDVQKHVDQEPVLSVQQVSDKSSISGAAYSLLGLGTVESFEQSTHISHQGPPFRLNINPPAARLGRRKDQHGIAVGDFKLRIDRAVFRMEGMSRLRQRTSFPRKCAATLETDSLFHAQHIALSKKAFHHFSSV
jgi:hypothetical protein